MQKDDFTLLQEFIRHRDSLAFRHLVERYSRLVYGAALRITGNPGQAEEAAQDVFVLLAKKPPAQPARLSLAGWLHRAATHFALHYRRENLRRREREQQAQAHELAPDTESDATWREIQPVLDEALRWLPEDDREAVLRRFFNGENLSEVGRNLHISEDAARMRISRALDRLRAFLTRRGITSATTALPAVLEKSAPGVISMDLVQKLSTEALGATSLTSHQLTIATLMSATKTSAVTIAAVALLSLSSGVFLGRTALAPKLAASSTQPPPAEAARTQQSAEANQATTQSAANTALANELTTVKAQLAAQTAKRIDLEKSLKELRAATDPLKEQVVVAYGKVGEIGQNFGDLFTEALALTEMEKNSDLDSPEGTKRLVAFMKKAASITGLSQEIISFEDNPAEGRGFLAAAYRKVFGLNDEETSKVEAYFEKTLTAAKEQKITLSSLPAHGTPEFMPWMEKRWAFFDASRQDLLNAIPNARRGDFEKWVEKGGYGFRNLTLRKGPLMFSLGGRPK